MLGFKCEEIILYDVFSLKIGSVSDLSFCDWLVLIVYWSKMCVLFFVVKNKFFLLLKWKSFFFLDDFFGYLEEKYVIGFSRFSEVEIKSFFNVFFLLIKIY